MTPWTTFWSGHMEFEYMLRILLSCLCGALIGLERTKRQKEAGLRTHILVAMGSALVMLVSKYGFFDVMDYDFLRADASRIGSTILTGISFLGAGIIIQKGNTVRGLTTAAGVWVTGGVGIAMGCGMYTLGIVCTLLMLFFQTVLKKWTISIDDLADHSIYVKLPYSPTALEEFSEWLNEKNRHARISAMEIREDTLALTVLVRYEDVESAVLMFSEYDGIKSIKM